MLELYSIKWEFDISKVDKKDFDKLEDSIFEEDEITLQDQNKIIPQDLGGNRAKTACCNIF